MSYLELSILIDLAVVSVCVLLLVRYGRISTTHPAAVYIFFHVYVVTTRLWSIAAGSPTLFSWGFPYEPVGESEIVRAAVLFDLALIVMTVAWLIVSRRDLTKNGPAPAAGDLPPGDLSKNTILRVVAFTLPIGIIALLVVARLPGVSTTVDIGEWSRSSWIGILPGWVGLSLLALIYWYGFRKPLVALMVLYLLLMVYQGYHRFRVYIPMILMMQIYLDRHYRRWPTVWMIIVLVAGGLLFFPMKSIGRGVQAGASISEITTLSGNTISDALSAQAGDQTFLDMTASALTLTDVRGEFYLGRPYLALLTLPVPRQWWPDKPGLADHLADISTSWRPMAQAGMIITYLGEAYLNFGYTGIILVPFLLAAVLARLYFGAYRRSYYSVFRFAYLMLAANLILVYRDGLTSIVVFTLVNMMPLSVIVFVHLLRSIPAPGARPRWRSVKPTPMWTPNHVTNPPASTPDRNGSPHSPR